MYGKSNIRKLALFTGIISAASVLSAGPTVIQDNRVTNIATTPVLGRGYSIATNTYQSTCLTGVKITEPSYDFTYTFDSVEKESDLKHIDTSSFSREFRNQLKDKIFTGKESGESERERTGKTTAKTESSTEKKTTSHNIFVIINLNSYYASVDESNTKMSGSAAQLILNRDFPGFFSSCGAYYIRSIGRNAKFVSIFTYKTVTEERDVKFETQIEEQIKGFGTRLEKSLNGDKTDPEKKKGDTERAETMNVSTVDHAGYEFRKSASSRNLTITVAAFGLGKNEKATLISYDIETFKAAIKDAFISMQNPMTGKVSSIEVVPWVENTEFQNLVKLNEDEPAEKDEESEKTVSGAADKSPKKGEKLLLYEKKQILNQNAEFLAEIERADRNIINIYYKARICKQQIDANYKNGGVFKPEFANARILSNRTGETKKLSELDGILTNERIEKFLDIEKEFMYGKSARPGESAKSGAAACMKKIISAGIFRVSYREIKECAGIAEKMSNFEDETVENYCMPILTRDREEKK